MLLLLLTLSTPSAELHQPSLTLNDTYETESVERALEARTSARLRVGLGWTFAPLFGFGSWLFFTAAPLVSGGEGFIVVGTMLSLLTSVAIAYAIGGHARLVRARRRIRRLRSSLAPPSGLAIFANPSGL